MKGTTEAGIKTALSQVKNLRARLQVALQESVSGRIKFKFQAIILSPPNTQVPNALIAKESTNEFVIKPLQYHQKAELFNYISNELSLSSERYKHMELKSLDSPLFIEQVISGGALPTRIRDEFLAKHSDKANNQQGVFIDYYLGNDEWYAALAIDNRSLTIGISGCPEPVIRKLTSEIESCGFTSPRFFSIEQIGKQDSE